MSTESNITFVSSVCDDELIKIKRLAGVYVTENLVNSNAAKITAQTINSLNNYRVTELGTRPSELNDAVQFYEKNNSYYAVVPTRDSYAVFKNNPKDSGQWLKIPLRRWFLDEHSKLMLYKLSAGMSPEALADYISQQTAKERDNLRQSFEYHLVKQPDVKLQRLLDLISP